MARYRMREDSGSTKTLLVAAGVVVGILAGAAVAQRLGGWRGIARRIRRGRGPLYDLLRENVSAESVERLLAGGRDVIELFVGEPKRRRGARRQGVDAVLDEYEVEDYERAAAGVDLDDDEPPSRSGVHLLDESAEDMDDAPLSAEDVEREVLRLFRRNRALRLRPIEIACDDDGVVELSGFVHSAREARAARRLALRVEGVSRVDVRLEVREPQAS